LTESAAAIDAMAYVSPAVEKSESNSATAAELLRATLRFNTLIFGVILGLLAGAVLFVLALSAVGVERMGGVAVALIGVFLPGYSAGWQGALIGFFWGFVIGAALGGMIYRINSVHVLAQLERLVLAQDSGDGAPRAVLRLHGPSLGLAIGAAGALGLIVTTNMLVARGTAGQSVHARLLSEVLPGYRVSPGGSLVGAIELFVVIYLFCHAFTAIYNSIAGRRLRR
jgi:hypothetical protein